MLDIGRVRQATGLNVAAVILGAGSYLLVLWGFGFTVAFLYFLARCAVEFLAKRLIGRGGPFRVGKAERSDQEY